jgi:hypothetical protein
MEARAMSAKPTSPPPRDRVAGAFLLALLAVGCVVLWIGIPWGGMWLTGEIADSSASQFLYALALIPATMFVWALGLAWINNLYMRITGIHRGDEEDEPGSWRRMRGPLEALLIASLALAIGALFVWFFLIAENPSQQVI